MEKSEEGVLSVLEAYAGVLGILGNGTTYLLYLSAAVLGGWLTSLAFAVMTPTWLALIIMTASFVLGFGSATYASSTIWRLNRSYLLHRVPREERLATIERGKKSSRVLAVTWIILFSLAFALTSSLPFTSLRIPIAVSLAVGLGNILLYMIGRLMRSLYDVHDLRPLIVGAYLLLTIPTYFLLPGEGRIPLDVLAFILLTVHLSASYFAAAISYFTEARRKVAGVLYAARG